MVSLTVNGKDYQLEVSPEAQLLWVIRDHLKLTGTKYSCGIGECGACTVHIDGKAENACTLFVKDVQGKRITTIEGIPEDHPVKRAWIEEQVVQCGYCQPGMIMKTAALIAQDRNPTPEKVIHGLDDVLCRCGSYARVKRGVETAIEMMRKEGKA